MFIKSDGTTEIVSRYSYVRIYTNSTHALNSPSNMLSHKSKSRHSYHKTHQSAKTPCKPKHIQNISKSISSSPHISPVSILTLVVPALIVSIPSDPIQYTSRNLCPNPHEQHPPLRLPLENTSPHSPRTELLVSLRCLPNRIFPLGWPLLTPRNVIVPGLVPKREGGLE